MHRLLCYAAAQHLLVHGRREGMRETHSRRALHTLRAQRRRVRGKKMEMERGDEERERARGSKK